MILTDDHRAREVYYNHRNSTVDQEFIMAAENQTQGQERVVPQGVAGAPNETVLLALMERTGYQMIQENGQRKYGGPPPVWEGIAPSRGCEVFVGKIPRDAYEDELVPVFEQIGKIYELRLMMDFSGTNRGYCFVMFTNKEDARKAVRELNNYELRKGRYLGVCLSVDNCRLFVGGIPKNKQRDEIFSEMAKITEGVVDVIVYPSASDKTKNRGFAFVEYNSHKAAAMARRKLIPGRIQLWGQSIAVDWAEPEAEVDDDVMEKVKILYVRNLMLTTSEDTIRDVFTRAVNKDNAIERVKKIRDYAFVHFRERDDAILAMNTLNRTLLENSQIEVCLAKPADKTEVRYTRGTAGRGASPGAVCINENPSSEAELKTGEALLEGYALNYDPMAYPGAAYYQQLGMHNPAAVAMARGFPQARPMQGHPTAMRVQGTSRGRGRGAAGMRGAGARSYLSGVRNGTFKKKSSDEPRYYDLRPDMVLTPTNPLTLKPQNVKSHVQVLEELCAKNGWAQPSYQLHSTMGHENSGRDVQLFLYKVNMPALQTAYQPTKLCRSTEEAKQLAAENVLKQLHIPVDPSGDGAQMAYTGQAATMGQFGLPSPTGTRALFPMTNGPTATATTTTSYPSTLTNGMPLVTSSYMMNPRMHHPALTQSHGQGDMVAFDAFNFSQLAAATPVYPPYPPHQPH